MTAPLAGSEDDEEADEEIVANYQRAISVSETNQSNGGISIGVVDGTATNDGTLLDFTNMKCPCARCSVCTFD